MTSEIVQLSEKLKSRVDTKLILLEYPEPNVVEIVPSGPDTFEISVGLYDEKWLVTSSFWCTVDCGSLENVYSLVCWLLTPYSRIVESWNGPQLLATWIEWYTEEGWESTDHNYLVIPKDDSPLTGATEMVIRHQAVFLDSAFSTHFPGAKLDQAGYPIGTLLGRTCYKPSSDGWHPVGVPTAD